MSRTYILQKMCRPLVLIMLNMCFVLSSWCQNTTPVTNYATMNDSILERYAQRELLPVVLRLYPFLNDSLEHYKIVVASKNEGGRDSFTRYSRYSFKSKNNEFYIYVSCDSLSEYYLDEFTSHGHSKNFLAAFCPQKTVITQELEFSEDPSNVNARYFPSKNYGRYLSQFSYSDAELRKLQTTTDTLSMDSLNVSIKGNIYEVLNFKQNKRNNYLIAYSQSSSDQKEQLIYQLNNADEGTVWKFSLPNLSQGAYVSTPTILVPINQGEKNLLSTKFYFRDLNSDTFSAVYLMCAVDKTIYFLSYHDSTNNDQQVLKSIPEMYRNQVEAQWKQTITHFEIIKNRPLEAWRLIVKDSLRFSELKTFLQHINYADKVLRPQFYSIFSFLNEDTLPYYLGYLRPNYWAGGFFRNGYMYTYYNSQETSPSVNNFSISNSEDSRVHLNYYCSNNRSRGFLSALISNPAIAYSKFIDDSINIHARYFSENDDNSILSGLSFAEKHCGPKINYNPWAMFFYSDTIHIDSLGLCFAGQVMEVLNYTNQGHPNYLFASINDIPNSPDGYPIAMKNRSSLNDSYFEQLSFRLANAHDGLIWEYHSPLDSVADYRSTPTLLSDFNHDGDCELRTKFYLQDRRTKVLTAVFLLFSAEKHTYLLSYTSGKINKKQLQQIPTEYRMPLQLEWEEMVKEYNLIKNNISR